RRPPDRGVRAQEGCEQADPRGAPPLALLRARLAAPFGAGGVSDPGGGVPPRPLRELGRPLARGLLPVGVRARARARRRAARRDRGGGARGVRRPPLGAVGGDPRALELPGPLRRLL